MREDLWLIGEPAHAFISSTLFEDDRQVTLELDRVSKTAQFLTARNCNNVLHSAELRMSKPDDRAAFAASIPDRDDDERQAIARELVQLFDRFRKTQPAVDSGPSADEKESAATRLVKLVEEDVVLIHNSEGDGFALMMVDGHKETWPLRSKGFKQWMARKFYEDCEKSPGSQAIQDALGVLEGKARYDGEERDIFVRVGEKDGKIYIDLGDDDWSAVEIDSEDWRITPIPPIEFKRSKGMRPLPKPERGGDIAALRKFLNAASESVWALV